MEKILERIKQLNLPEGQYMVCGSAILEIFGIREAKDIDILVSPELYLELQNKHGWSKHPVHTTSIEHPEHIAGAKQSLDFMKENYSLAEALPQAEIIENIPFMNLKMLLEAKKQLGREKDLKDIELIEKYYIDRSNPVKNTEVMGWIELADEDYFAARVLINNAVLLPAAVLSSTAIEKYLKMIHRIRDWKFNGRDEHNALALYKNLRQKGLGLVLNEDYLKFLTKIYEMRYPDKIQPGFSFALNQTKLLVGLDESVYKIKKRLFLITKDTGKKVMSKFEAQLEAKDQRLLKMNHSFGDIKREELFKNPCIWNEKAFLKEKVWLEFGYIGKVKDDGLYNLDGLRRGSDDKQFTLQSEPIDLTKS